jgi:hypothetical protein
VSGIVREAKVKDSFERKAIDSPIFRFQVITGYVSPGAKGAPKKECFWTKFFDGNKCNSKGMPTETKLDDAGMVKALTSGTEARIRLAFDSPNYSQYGFSAKLVAKAIIYKTCDHAGYSDFLSGFATENSGSSMGGGDEYPEDDGDNNDAPRDGQKKIDANLLE